MDLALCRKTETQNFSEKEKENARVHDVWDEIELKH